MASTPAAAPEAGCATLVRVYNKFVADLALSLKAHSPSLKRALKARYRAIDLEAHGHVQRALQTLQLERLVEADPDEVLDDAAVGAFEPLPGIPVSSFVGDLRDVPGALHTLRMYLYILGVLCVTYRECAQPEGPAAEGERADARPLVRNVLGVLSRAQQGGAQQGEEDDDELGAIMDDDIAALLARVRECAVPPPSAGEEDAEGGAPDIEKALEGSKIADLAREIAAEVDMSSLPPAGAPLGDILSFDSLSDKNSVLGGIVSKVGAKIQDKIASGEMKHDELLGEAMNLLKMFDGPKGAGGAAAGHPLLSSMMRAATRAGISSPSAAGSGSAAASAARDRLRQKLEKRQQEQQQPDSA